MHILSCKISGVTIRSPERNHNQSEIHVMFDSGAGIRVAEAHGVLSVMSLLPPDFNETFAVSWLRFLLSICAFLNPADF